MVNSLRSSEMISQVSRESGYGESLCGTSYEGESPIETLRRELQEELELEVNSNNLLLQTVKYENNELCCMLHLYCY